MGSKKGFFVAIEGGDGLGKTTLIENLKKVYTDAVFTFEPGGTDFGRDVRKLIMESEGISYVSEMYLFCASRSEFVTNVVLKNLNANKLVISDRFVMSSMVYQGILGGIGYENVLKANELALQGVMPNLCIILYGEKSFREQAFNRFDSMPTNQQQIVNKGFKMLGEKLENCEVIDVTNLNENEVLSRAIELIEKYRNKG